MLNAHMKHAGKWSAVLLLVAGSLVGCETPPVKPKPMPVAAPVPQTRAEMTQALAQEDADFGTEVAKLPGFSAEDHRETLVMLLDRLPKMLKLINGENESPEFKNRIAVIEAAKATVSSETVERRRMEAVENQALQSAAPAFEELASRYLYDDKDLPPLLSNLDSAVSTAAKSVGPMHDLDAATAFVATQAVVDRFTYDLVEKFLPEALPGPSPDQPVTPPATPAAPETPATPATPATAPTTDTTAPAATPATAPAADATTPATAPTTSP
jgi:hypothetical protein